MSEDSHLKPKNFNPLSKHLVQFMLSFAHTAIKTFAIVFGDSLCGTESAAILKAKAQKIG